MGFPEIHGERDTNITMRLYYFKMIIGDLWYGKEPDN
jgi:hypothetical protein